MTTGQAITVVFMVTNTGTPRYNTVIQVDGSTITAKYLGGTAWTTGTANAIDIYEYIIIKTGSAAFTVIANKTAAA